MIIMIGVHAVEISSMTQAINIAGKQRMLSYRILKDYLMVSMESAYRNPKEDMDNSIKYFDEAKKALAEYNSDSEIQKLTEKVGKAFAAVKEMVAQPFDASKGEEYLQKATDLKVISHQLVLRLQEISGKQSAVIVNKSGRLRAVSQRINSLYLLKTMDVSSQVVDKEMKEAMKLFRENLDFLEKAEPKGKEIDSRLKKLEKIYLFFQIMNASDNYVPTIITKKSDKMLKYGDELTTLYIEKLK